jgi:hypothetical protein
VNAFPVDELGHPIYAVIPVDDKKRALIKWKDYQQRLPTEEEKRKWIEQFGERIAGWAMPTGQVSGIIVLDFDGEIGLQTMQNLGLKSNVKTAGGGAHVWLEAPNYPVRTGAVNSQWPGMELKGDGGYVIVVGSNIRSSHVGSPTVIGDYQIVDGIPSTKHDLEEDLATFVYQPKEANRDYAAARVVAEALEMANSGRNNAGFWLACQLRDLGNDKEETWNILEDVFYPQTPKGQSPYTKKELKDSLNSAFTKPANKNSASLEALALLNGIEAELWHTAENEPYITAEGENFLVGSLRTRELISALYFDKNKKPLNKTALEEVIDTLKWTANRQGKEYDKSMRVAYKEDGIHIDNEGDIEGIKFVRTKVMGKMPKPKRGKSLQLLRKYLNVNDEDFTLVEGLLVSHFMPDGPYPIGAFVGPQGSAKSTNQSLILAISDPRLSSEAGRNRLPRNDNDLVVMAKQNRVLSFDNVSAIPEWLSDAFCTLSTGGGMMRRRLYTDDDVISYSQKKPILINGIGDIVTRPDLLDRAIVIECPLLERYRSEREMYAEFNEDLPYILGAVLELSEKAYFNIDGVKADESVRMADFLRWCVAAGIKGFSEAFIANRNRGAEIAINNSAVGRFLKEMADKHRGEPTNPALLERLRVPEELASGKWVGYMHTLYEQGELVATGAYDWPKKFESFVNQVYRVEPMLNRLGIRIDKHKTNFMEITFIGYENGN